MESANAGLTMEMPNGYFFADFLAQAVADGTVSQTTLDTMVVPGAHPDVRVRPVRQGAQRFDRDATVTTAAHAQVALQGAEEGTVLLKNNGILPLSTASTHVDRGDRLGRRRRQCRPSAAAAPP